MTDGSNLLIFLILNASLECFWKKNETSLCRNCCCNNREKASKQHSLIPREHLCMMILTIIIVLTLDLVLRWTILILIISLLLWTLVSGWPCHLVLLLKSPPGIGEPCGHLCQGHLGDYGQHDLLPFGWIWVLPVLLQPGLQRAGGLTCGVFPPRSSIHWTISVKQRTWWQHWLESWHFIKVRRRPGKTDA